MHGNPERRNSTRPAMRWAAVAALWAGCLVVGGCNMYSMYSTKPAPATPKPPDPEIDDPCILRLEKVSEQFCLYYLSNRELPETLDDLKKAAGAALPPLVCPKCGRPYLYSREGLEVPGTDKRVLVYDSEPCHGGKRRVIIMDPIRPARGIVTDVKTFFNGPMFDPEKASNQ
jgi:hypothetical protein